MERSRLSDSQILVNEGNVALRETVPGGPVESVPVFERPSMNLNKIPSAVRNPPLLYLLPPLYCVIENTRPDLAKRRHRGYF